MLPRRGDGSALAIHSSPKAAAETFVGDGWEYPFPGIRRLYSKRRSCGGLRHQMQITGIGRVAPQSERLAAPGRGHLPRDRILQRRYKCAAVRGRYFQGHLYEPGVDGRKWKFFRMNNSGDAREPRVAAGRCRRRRICQRRTCQRRACQHCRRGNGEFHVVCPVGMRSRRQEASDDLDESACSVNQKQDACLHRSNRCRCCAPARVAFRAAA